MKFFYFFVTVSLIGISCRKNSTIYNGFIKNDTKTDITFKIIADSSLADSFNLASKSSVLVFTYQEEGDFELYDCTSFFDTLYFTRNDTDFFLVPLYLPKTNPSSSLCAPVHGKIVPFAEIVSL